ncbi:MAG: hypothetical protein JW855_02150 [Gammaproteobacteria bacterium]|nr:hypothetical protein [Gammaproteobacteria bacterium]
MPIDFGTLLNTIELGHFSDFAEFKTRLLVDPVNPFKLTKAVQKLILNLHNAHAVRSGHSDTESNSSTSSTNDAWGEAEKAEALYQLFRDPRLAKELGLTPEQFRKIYWALTSTIALIQKSTNYSHKSPTDKLNLIISRAQLLLGAITYWDPEDEQAVEKPRKPKLKKTQKLLEQYRIWQAKKKNAIELDKENSDKLTKAYQDLNQKYQDQRTMLLANLKKRLLDPLKQSLRNLPGLASNRIISDENNRRFTSLLDSVKVEVETAIDNLESSLPENLPEDQQQKFLTDPIRYWRDRTSAFRQNLNGALTTIQKQNQPVIRDYEKITRDKTIQKIVSNVLGFCLLCIPHLIRLGIKGKGKGFLFYSQAPDPKEAKTTADTHAILNQPHRLLPAR